MSNPSIPPEGWVRVPLADLLLKIEAGKSFKCDERPPTRDEVGVVKVSAVTWGEFQEQESKTCTDESRIDPALFVKPGDFLFSRANTIELVGACVIAKQVNLRVMLSDKILRLNFANAALKPWALYFLRSQDGRAQIEALSTGNQESMRNIGQERLGQITVPIPPANEQTRIVAKLEEVLSDLDAGVAELQAAQAKLAQYRQSLLKAAVEGALTADWRARHTPSETGAQLLARILTERRSRWESRQLARFQSQGKTPPKGWQRKYPEPVAPDTRDLPELPEGWVWASAEQLAELVSGHTPKDADAHASSDGAIHWFKVGDMNREGNESWLRTAQTRFDQTAALDLCLKIAPAGTIVFPKRGGAIATNKKRRLSSDACFDLNTMGLIPCESSAEWLWWWFQGIDLGRLSDGSNVPQINNPDIAPLPVPIPPAAEQAIIIEYLETGFGLIASQTEAIEVALKQAAAQRQNLLTAAFSGQLVPQDPADEPASALLERIRNQAAAPRSARTAGASRRSPSKVRS